jgi:hypothetical protein
MQETATSIQILVSLYLWQLNVSKVDERKVGENMQVRLRLLRRKMVSVGKYFQGIHFS